jgi:hypothetical protein
MMEDSRSRKTVRQFNCRDALWTIFEEMARELECSVDYLINEAMRQYAKSRRYAVPAAEQPGAGAGGLPAPGAPAPGAPRTTPPSGLPPRPPRPTGALTPARTSPLPAAPPPVAGGGGMPPRPTAPGAPPPGRQSLFPIDARATSPAQPPAPEAPPSALAPETDAFAQLRRTGVAGSAPVPSSQPLASPPPSAGGPVSFEVAKASTGQGRAPLYIIFNGQRIPIRKEQFIIGRGLKTSDLAIKDTNISRRHAAVLFHNGAYYIKDLNSTNGIEYNGMRIDSKRIEEGDGFKICDYEFKFTYHG